MEVPAITKLILILFSFFAASVCLAQLPDCLSAVAGRETSAKPNDDRVYLIAEGEQKNTTLFRIIPREGSSYIRKEYRDSVKYIHELNGYRLLRRAVDRNPGLNFAVSHVLREDEQLHQDMKILRLEDIWGRTLRDVIADPRIASSLREKIKNAYDQKLKQLKEELSQIEPSANVTEEIFCGSPKIIFWKPSECRAMASIRSDQVVVSFEENSESFKLTIIDPY